MEYRVIGNIRHNGKRYTKGDVWDVELSDAQTQELVNDGMLEAVTEQAGPTEKTTKAKKAKPTEKETVAGEKKEQTYEPVATNAGKTKLMAIAKEEHIELQEEMTPEEMRLAINKARQEKAK